MKERIPKFCPHQSPTGALDAKTTKEIMGVLRRLNENGKTVVAVTHDRDFAAYAKRIINIEDGLITDFSV